jgi:hypothetical protein
MPESVSAFPPPLLPIKGGLNHGQGRPPHLDGQIDEILPDGRFGVMLENDHRIIAYTAGKMRASSASAPSWETA